MWMSAMEATATLLLCAWCAVGKNFIIDSPLFVNGRSWFLSTVFLFSKVIISVYKSLILSTSLCPLKFTPFF